MLALPAQWEAVNVDREGIESILNILKGLDSEWARNAAQMFSAEAIQQSIKFWAMDTKPAGAGYASVNVTFQQTPFATSSDDLCIQMPSVYKQMGIKLLDTECGLEINELEAARFTVSLRAGPFAVKQYQYIYTQGRNIWVMTLAVDEMQWTKYQITFETIAESFRLNK